MTVLAGAAPIDRTRVWTVLISGPGCLPVVCGVGGGLGQQKQDNHTGGLRGSTRRLDFSPWDAVQTPRAIGQAEAMGAEEEVLVTLSGEPLGLPTSGGRAEETFYRCPR